MQQITDDKARLIASEHCNIGLIDADLIDGGTKFPNLALMKISGYFKGNNCNVSLIESLGG